MAIRHAHVPAQESGRLLQTRNSWLPIYSHYKKGYPDSSLPQRLPSPGLLHCEEYLGSSTVLGCRYHGWSYDTPGNLIKAPGFDDVLSFDKSAEWDVQTKTYTARQGLIFVNFDASPDSISFEEYYKGLEDECDDVDFSEFEYIESWELDGQFNWKTLMDGYHECHHCPTADPSFSKAIKGHVV